jgi:hypothetical protein
MCGTCNYSGYYDYEIPLHLNSLIMEAWVKIKNK